MSLLSELKRRNVFRVAVAYAVVAWVVIQVVDILAPRMALPEWVPGFVILMLVIGFPIALVFAWAYEITPEGLKKTKEVDTTVSVTANTGRKIDRMIIAALALAVTVLLVDRFAGRAVVAEPPGPQPAMLGASIAVLPFVNLSSDPEQEFFSDGISEELLNLLAQIPDLRVAARTSSFQFKGENQDVTEIGRQLNVAHVLEGSVRRSGGDVRITAQLIDADNGYHLWSDTYTRELEDIFRLQDEISGAIVGALREELGLDLRSGMARDVSTSNEEAYEAFLRGRHLVVQRTRPTIEAAIEEFRTAVTLDPEYALAHAELALAINFLDYQQYGDLSRPEILERGGPHVERALELDPGLAEAHAAQGHYQIAAQQPTRALTSLDRAVEINPNYAAAHNWRANILFDELGRYREALEEYEVALTLDPLSVPAQANVLRSLYTRRQVAEAEALFGKLRRIAPGLALFLKHEEVAQHGRFAEAAGILVEALREEPGAARFTYALGRLLGRLDLLDEAVRLVPEQNSFFFAAAGDPRAWLDATDRDLANEPDNLALLALRGTALAAMGDLEPASTVLEAVWDEVGHRVGQVGPFSALPAAALLHVRTERGEDPEPVRAAILENSDQLAAAGYRLAWRAGFAASAEYAAGREREAFAAIEEGGIGVEVPEGLAFFQSLYEDPAWSALREAREAALDRERAALLEQACGGAWSDVWRPLPQNCEGR
ncbi:MAG TPA: tetratricopeptide repeat protein [Longimicrobiales bacterium]|nr:tetratricopeptide repeat protein [Longimicrobiales bacterium]